MNFKTTIFLIFCLAIAGVAVYVTRNQPATESAPPAVAKLVDVPSADITKLSVAPADDKTIVLEKQGEKWQLTEPVKAPADAGNVDALVSAVSSLESHGKTDAGGANG